MGSTPGAAGGLARGALLALVAAAVATGALAQAREEAPKPAPPRPLPSVGIALELAPHETQAGTYAAEAIVTDAITGRRLSQSWVAVKVGSFADMRARVKPESGGGRTLDLYMTVSIGEDENEAGLTTTYRLGGRLLLKQETSVALGSARTPEDPGLRGE